jgi:hypothetical protein
MCTGKDEVSLACRLQGKAKPAARESRNAVVNLSNRLDRLERETWPL